jgi:hypothetical protein
VNTEEERFVARAVRPGFPGPAALEEIAMGKMKVKDMRQLILKMVLPSTVFSGIPF